MPEDSTNSGNPSFAGYEYQILATVWVALDLMIAKERADRVTIEARSHEDIEAAVANPDVAELGLDLDGPDMVMFQIKSRRTAPWTTRAFGEVFVGRTASAGARGPARRERPLALLRNDAKRRYIFITNESLDAGLRPHRGQTLRDFPEVTLLPPNAKDGLTPAQQAQIAPRMLICDGVTSEVLNSRIKTHLAEFGHVPTVRHDLCLAALCDAVQARIAGRTAQDLTKVQLIEILHAHDGSVLPNRMMSHYVKPHSFDAIREGLEARHAVIIAGPSGTGKTLTADVLELELRSRPNPFEVIVAKDGPGDVRDRLRRSGAVLFHLRDPWGGNRLSPRAEHWNDELPKLLREAGPERKFLITSRSDVIAAAGVDLFGKVKGYVVPIEIDDYDDRRRGEIYDALARDLVGPAVGLARDYRENALETLSRPYEIDRFIAALGAEDVSRPTKIERLLEISQIDAISNIITNQLLAREHGVAEAAVLWAILKACGAADLVVLRRLFRSMRSLDPTLRGDIDSLADFMVAGRNLRRDDEVLTLHHPRVEDGLRQALLNRRSDAGHVLTLLADAVIAADAASAGDWGVETALDILKAAQETEALEIEISADSAVKLDAYLDRRIQADHSYGVQRAFADLAAFASKAHPPGQLARLLSAGTPRSGFVFARWSPPDLDAPMLADLRGDPRIEPMLQRFIREVLPDTHLDFGARFLDVARSLGVEGSDPYREALDRLMDGRTSGQNIELIVRGALSDETPAYDAVIQRIAEGEADVDRWMEDEYRELSRRAEEHEIDAAYADHIIDQPSDRYFTPGKAMETVVSARLAAEGPDWAFTPPYRAKVFDALCEVIREAAAPATNLIKRLIDEARGHELRRAWRAASRHWSDAFRDRLKGAVVSAINDQDGLAEELLEIAGEHLKADIDAFADEASRGMPPPNRLDLIARLAMTQRRIPGEELDLRTAANAVAKVLAAPFDAVAQVLVAALEGGELRPLGLSLSSAAEAACLEVLSKVATEVAGPLLCVLASIGRLDLPTVTRLLATEDAKDGLTALCAMALVADADADAGRAEVLRAALSHPRYVVRREAMRQLAILDDPADTAALLRMADDRSADVRLAFAAAAETHRWPWAESALVSLLTDSRNYDQDRGGGEESWPQFRVARAAADALRASPALSAETIDRLLDLLKKRSGDPFVDCHIIAALAVRPNTGVTEALLAALASPSLQSIGAYRPIAQAAAWAFVDRLVVGGISPPADVAPLAVDGAPELAGPLLMTVGCSGGPMREAVVRELELPASRDRLELVRVAAALGDDPLSDEEGLAEDLRRKVHADEVGELFESDALTRWSLGLDLTGEITRYSAWIADLCGLPLNGTPPHPRKYRLPERVGVLTMRSLTPAREDFTGVDEGD